MASNRQTFTIAESPEAFKVLSSNLYSNPVLAVIRELSTNAYDAQIVADTNDEHPVEVHLPTYEEQFFRVRDWGNGLSEDEVFTIYTQFFSSTKKEDENQIGAFGLGSKSPFAVTSKYNVNSYQNGEVKRYLMDAENSYPTVTLTATEKTDEHDGLEVIVDLSEKKDFYPSSWIRNAIQLYKGTAFLPQINLDEDQMNKILQDREYYTTENVTWWKDAHAAGKSSDDAGQVTINVAGATFSVRNVDGKFTSSSFEAVLYRCLRIYSVNIMAEKFDVTLTPSREELHYDDKTVRFIKNRIITLVSNKIKELDENNTKDLQQLLMMYDQIDGVTDLCGSDTANVVIEKTKKFLDVFTDTGKRKILCAYKLGTTQNFPFLWSIEKRGSFLHSFSTSGCKGVYYVNFDGATKAQEKALDKLVKEGSLHNNVINCLASHFQDVVLQGQKESGASIYYIFRKLDKAYTKLFNVKEIKIKDFENYFKRFNVKDDDIKASSKVVSHDSFINSQTLFFYNGYSADLSYFKEHKDELKDVKFMKVIGTTYNSVKYDTDFFRKVSAFLDKGYAIAYRRGTESWFAKKAAEDGIITKDNLVKNIQSYNPEKYDLMKKVLKLANLENVGSPRLNDVLNYLDKFSAYLNLDNLNKLLEWQVLTDPLYKVARRLDYDDSAFLKHTVFKEDTSYMPTDEEVNEILKEDEALKFLNAISMWRLTEDENSIKIYCDLVNRLVASYLESKAA